MDGEVSIIQGLHGDKVLLVRVKVKWLTPQRVPDIPCEIVDGIYWLCINTMGLCSNLHGPADGIPVS